MSIQTKKKEFLPTCAPGPGSCDGRGPRVPEEPFNFCAISSWKHEIRVKSESNV
jgi:hypothetical protein